MAKVLKIVLSDFSYESRDKREILCLIDMGHQVVVMAKSNNNEYQVIKQDGYEIHFLPTDTKKANGKRSIYKTIMTVINWIKYARNIKPDCISGHDLIPLTIGYLSTLFTFREKKPMLVYDSHEFEIGRNTASNNKLRKLIISKVEKFLIKKCAFSIMVNDSIADEIQKRYSLKEKPIVVRNVPNIWKIDPEICQQKRKEIYNRFSISKDTYLLMFHGGIARGRGIGQVIKSLSELKNVAFVILGYGEAKKYYAAYARDLGVIDRVIFLDAVPLGELWEYIGAADLSICMPENICESYYLSLPNKLFEAIQSETPVLGSDFPEIARIINKYKIGVVVDPENVEQIINVIKMMIKDKELYNEFKINLKYVKNELCWEKEQRILKEAYARILA